MSLSLIFKNGKNDLVVKKLVNCYKRMGEDERRLAQVAFQMAYNEGYNQAKADIRRLQPKKFNFDENYYYNNDDRYY